MTVQSILPVSSKGCITQDECGITSLQHSYHSSVFETRGAIDFSMSAVSDFVLSRIPQIPVYLIDRSCQDYADGSG